MLHDKVMFSLFSLTHSYEDVSAIKHFYSIGIYMTLFLTPFDLHLVYFSYYVTKSHQIHQVAIISSFCQIIYAKR